MTIAATISLPLTFPARHSFTSRSPTSLNVSPFSSSSSSSVQPSFLILKTVAFRSPNFRVSATSMSIEALEKDSQTSFLDRKESGFLHFVKYHGLGNDFILVILLLFSFVWLLRKMQ
ncbi:hypothetical protein PVL29_010163 [Vitis rotundifolia]|uniref:Uncharacterized protein n=1 Tax=Vitis rotundifolia TaxID=103349 RepID=A0AA38ZSL5_VITRO|nr:hypothetical protein PVL29_010163 [Vitis rotundifolia]